MRIQLPEREWISEVLGVSVHAMEVRPMETGRGFQSTTWQLLISCDPPGSPPRSMVLKSETTNPDANEFTRLNQSFQREVGVYNHLVPRLNNHRPIVHGCSAEEPCWLLMEDLSHLRCGDQLQGLTHSETLAALQRMALLHAKFWLDPDLEQHAWLPSHSFWFQSPQPELVGPFFEAYRVRLGEKAYGIVRAVLEQGETIDAALAERPWTLVHGDLRADNLLFGGPDTAPVATIIDWSWACRSLATVDLAFLIGGSEPVMQRYGRLDELLQGWHGALLDEGVRDYPLADARRDLQLAALRSLTTAIAMYRFLLDPAVSVRTALFVDQAIQRHSALVMELEAWRALPKAIQLS
ncbi:MAG: phosphotransferase [Synechococcaceae cyanobacterium ELA739]